MEKKCRILLITGLMASGKSTVAQRVAESLPRAVHLRGDAFRRMIVSGREDMGMNASDEALRQLELRYRLTANAARRYWDANFHVIVQDNYYGPMLPHMIELLEGMPVQVVVLCPSADTIMTREQSRSKTGYGSYAVTSLYKSFMTETPRIGHWLDTSVMSPEETAQTVLEIFMSKEN